MFVATCMFMGVELNYASVREAQLWYLQNIIPAMCWCMGWIELNCIAANVVDTATIVSSSVLSITAAITATNRSFL